MTEEGSVTCSVCLSIFEAPMRVKECNHVFCSKCVDSILRSHSPLCPLCRCRIGDTAPALDITDAMRMGIVCRCGERVDLPKMSEHKAACKPKHDTSPNSLIGPERSPPPAGPNRSTFSCPLCNDGKHLDCKDLVEHVNLKHSRGASPAVCPVCASMPWGDPNYVSGNFVQHCNLRHKYDVSNYVDYSEADDEEAIMQRVLAASCTDK